MIPLPTHSPTLPLLYSYITTHHHITKSRQKGNQGDHYHHHCPSISQSTYPPTHPPTYPALIPSFTSISPHHHNFQCTEQKVVKKETKEIVTTITSRRFIIAVGGRPTPLDVPVGGELAISSDDLFMKKVHHIVIIIIIVMCLVLNLFN